MALPKKYAKMGFKRGWAAFNKTRKKSKTKNRSVQTMARRRKGSFRRYAKRTYSKAKSGFSFGKVTNILIGVGICALYEVFVSPMIPLDAMTKNIAELVAGVALMVMPGMPSFIKSAGLALVVVNAYSLLVPLISGMSSNAITQTSWSE